ncbi:prolipoprotein diacylglyceryl transferase [Natronorubrum tibetense]|nr:hypothetical protein [Natronorubrum tibetense]
MDPGIDLAAAAELDDTDDLEPTDGEGETDEMSLVDELDTGTDLESAAESNSGGASPETESSANGRPETALDPDVGDHASSEADPRPETELEPAESAASDESVEPAVGETATIEESEETASDIVPGVDIESAVESDDQRAAEIDPDALAGRGAGDESAADDVTPQRVSDDEVDSDTASDRAARARVDDDGTATATDAESRDLDRSRSSTPLAATLAAQRAAMTSGQELVEQSLTVQQRAARAAVATPLLAQRQGVENAKSATQQYFDAVTALTGTGSSDSHEQQSLSEAIDELEAAHRGLPDEDLSRQLADHLEELRSLQEQFGDDVERESERVVDLLERQADLLEACRDSIEADSGETDR